MIKRLRTDKGGEYESNYFKEFCEQNGIIHKVTHPYLPESNGVAERNNITLKEMMNAMLVKSGLPTCGGKPFFWLVTFRIKYLIRKPVKLLMNFGKVVSLVWDISKCGDV
jgi:transposase InsO family protein